MTELRDEPWIVGKGLRDDPQFGAWPTIEHPRIAYAAREWPTRLGIAVLPEVAAAAIPTGVRTVRVDDPAWLGRAVVAVTVRARSPEVTATVFGADVSSSIRQAAGARSTARRVKPGLPGGPTGRVPPAEAPPGCCGQRAWWARLSPPRGGDSR
ncbi:hypothetical protein ACQ4WX_26335 [Streptomyces lasalocidi]